MKVISVNISEPQELIISGKKRLTGIFKKPVEEIFLAKDDVENDHVQDRKHHGGSEKACYVFSTDHYDYWKEKYPNLNWDWGMFGENISIENWDENMIRIGDVFRMGEAIVQCAQPRIPCSTLSSKFGEPKMLKEFADYHSPGSYLRILEEGIVRPGDEIRLEKRDENSMSMLALYQQIFPQSRSNNLIEKALEEKLLSEEFKTSLRKRT